MPTITAETRIGRLLPASLHQAIAEVVPQRSDFYEEWLGSDGVRGGTIGLAPILAVLGFLRTEAAYDQIVARAGGLAAEWTMELMPSLQRRIIALLPRSVRTRAALRVAAGIVRQTCSASRASSRVRRGTARLDVAESLFCQVREARSLPLCGFYASVAVTVLAAVGIPARAQVAQCRAVGASTCVIALDLSGAGSEPGKAMAA